MEARILETELQEEPRETTDEASKGNAVSYRHMCPHCSKTFCDAKGVTRHIHKTHADMQECGKLKCSYCDLRFSRMTSLMKHTESIHDVPVNTHVQVFDTFDVFLAWKNQEEQATKSYYVQHCGPTKNQSVHYHYFYCNRSGCYEAKGNGKRNLKCQKSSKIEATCISHMKVDECVKTGSCTVNYTTTHTGHEKEVSHLPISEDVKARIAIQLHEGVSVSRIMDDIRDVSMNQSVTRQHLIVRQDINNIRRMLNLQNVQKHSNDQSSIAMWVRELQEQDYNPILAFKAQGEIAGEDMDDLGEDNFLLCIQTEFQKDIMLKYGNQTICIDATHGTNMYDFLLVTVMVIDTFGEGIPVAWAVTDKEDACTLTQFFKPLHKRVGDIKPFVFMSDDAQQYYNAWCGVFGHVPHKLLCMWHVDRSWRQGIQQYITDSKDKVEVYHTLRILLTETDEDNFRFLLQKSLTYLESSYPSFYNYFLTTYVSRVDQWATCHRQHMSLNTNMVLESFHRVLKVVYLEKKQNRRIDNLLSVLLKINRDTMFNTLRKEEIGKVTHRVRDINRRHALAQRMMDKVTHQDVVQCSNSRWQVMSEDHGSYYDVVNIGQHDNCPLTCTTCNVCIHMFTCTCIDAVLHHTICKHIHLLHLRGFVTSTPADLECITSAPAITSAATTSTGVTVQAEPMTSTQNVIPPGDRSSLIASSHFRDTNSSSCSKDVVLKKVDHLKKLLLESTDGSNFAEVNLHLTSSISLMEASKTLNKPQPIVRKRPFPNSNNITQRRFHSTKKKKETHASRMGKPTRDDENIIKKGLQVLEPSVCGVCFKLDDHTSSKEVIWIECSICAVWIHKACGVKYIGEDSYICTHHDKIITV